MDFIDALFTDFSEIHGDRAFGDDPAMSCGMAFFHDEPVMVIANLKGRTVKERVTRKFGSPEPEGYRKALRAMQHRRKIRPPRLHLPRLRRSLPRHRSRRARPGRSHRPQPPRDVPPPRPHHRHHHRRRRLRRSPRPRSRRPRPHARERHLLRHLPRGLRLHHVEGRHQASSRPPLLSTTPPPTSKC